MQTNSGTNTLLLLILAVLLFGSGAVLGFFSVLFWIIVGLILIIAVIWFIFQTPKIVSGVVEEQRAAYIKHPIGILFSLIILAILFGFSTKIGSFSAVIWIILIIGLTIWLITVMARESKKTKFKSEEDKIYEETHYGWERKKIFGSNIEMNKVDYGTSWVNIILITIGLFVLMFIIGAISSRF